MALVNPIETSSVEMSKEITLLKQRIPVPTTSVVLIIRDILLGVYSIFFTFTKEEMLVMESKYKAIRYL